MSDTIYDSRFIKKTDPQNGQLIFKLPEYWWSRAYEYEWASRFAKAEDISLDAACGIEHPLKFYLLDNCKEVYACDIDPRIESKEKILEGIETVFGKEAAGSLPARYVEKINYSRANLTELPYENNKFDKVYCISVLEHLSEKVMENAFIEFKRVLKEDGQIILTFDYPTINLALLSILIKKLGLRFVKEADYILPEDALYTNSWGGLYCFRAVLLKEDGNTVLTDLE